MKEFDLEPGETIVLEARKHWFIFLAELLPYAIIAVIPFALPALLTLAPVPTFATAFFTYSSPLSRVALGVWLLLTWTSAWGTFTKYFLNAWILTQLRIVDIKQRRFFAREVSSVFLTRVQDVTSDVSGVLHSLLGIGDIQVQTAGEDIEFVMHGIPHPDAMRDLILAHVPRAPEAQTTGT